MKNVNVRKLALAGILVAVGIVCSPLSIPVGASRCAPVQHFINILGGVFLGPWYSLGMAFITSLLRNLMGTGTLLAFPGSMCGALICGLLYQYTRRLPLAYLGELFGTSSICLCPSFLYIQLRRDHYRRSAGYRPETDQGAGCLSGKVKEAAASATASTENGYIQQNLILSGNIYQESTVTIKVRSFHQMSSFKPYSTI